MRILVVEDEKDLLDITVKRLKSDGFGVDECLNGEDALYYTENTQYDLVILDIMIPKIDGLTVLRTLRSNNNNIPILLLTARDSINDRVEGLNAGADDYLIKPFVYDELIARIRALLRRNSNEKTDKLKISDLTMELSTKKVFRGDKEILLSSKEFSLLEYLMRNKGAVISRSQLENHVWDYNFEGGSNIVDVYIRYLRKKVDEPFDIKLIHTIRGMGYSLRE